MAKTVWASALAAFTIVVVLVAACGDSTGDTTSTRIGTATPMSAVPTPTEDAGVLDTRIAGSTAAKLGPTLLSTADYPPDLNVQQQETKIVAARDVPGLTSEASGFFATVATASGDEFVNLIVLAVDGERGALTPLDSFTPENYLPGLTAGSRDATTSPLDVGNAPSGSKGFSYAGSLPVSAVPGQAAGQIEGQALGFVRGSTYILLVHGMYVPSARGIDVAKIAGAIDARLAGGGTAN